MYHRWMKRSRARRVLLAVVVLSCFDLAAVASAQVPQTTAPAPSSLAVLGQSLFNDIVQNERGAARNLFFPRAAYVAMKTKMIAYPASDYDGRLLAFFNLDLDAYHRFLGAVPVRYVRSTFLAGGATWIAPGVCENAIGYWHEPAIRLVYSQGGVTKSFAVDSLISWRGRYYVIHLGPNPRPYNVGTVDSPTRGAGVPGPAGGC